MSMDNPNPAHERRWLGELEDCVQRLAMPAAEQFRQYRGFTGLADELALDFAQALEVCEGNGYLQGHPAAPQLSALDQALERMSGTERADLWTLEALELDGSWSSVRRLAHAALLAAGWADDPPPSSAFGRFRH